MGSEIRATETQALQSLLQEVQAHKTRVDKSLRLLRNLGRLDRDRLGNAAKLQRQLEAVRYDLREMATSAPDHGVLMSRCAEYESQLNRALADLRKKLGAALDEEARAAGMRITGQYPDLALGIFTIELEFDRQRATLWYGPKQERIGQLRMLARDIVQEVQGATERLGSQLDADEFGRRLQLAYQRAGDGSGPVPIGTVLREMAFEVQGPRFQADPRRENYRGYGRADFSYDLYRIAAHGHTMTGDSQLKLVIATRALTRNRRDFLWVPQGPDVRGNYYSHLAIEEVRT